ncbi:uncharacterized protein [Halyomorpha halys]|uniref:uncharacterized protein isoform X3 n=1 Tax=Halyomorpha halys TaxID=286706 RepID=UPI0006D50E99|nr:uncharacterized protein LOC106686730 isoform X3 [Halyomorpha halys]
MKVVALISGGKDSCYNMLQCVMAGHDIVALANLKPESKVLDELDSYMYQTVGHQGVELYAEAMNIPLFRQPTHGVAYYNEKHYTPTPEDEVEDLYQLLLNVKENIEIEAVSVGAVLSDYQRLRVENVDDFETVIHSNDGIAPVGYLNFTRLRLTPKEDVDEDATLLERLQRYKIKTAEDYITDIDQAEVTDTEVDAGSGEHKTEHETSDLLEIRDADPTPYKPSVATNASGWSWFGGITGANDDISLATEDALQKLNGLLLEKDLNTSNLVRICMYVRDMSSYSEINSAYLKIIEGPNPPVRVCLGTRLNEGTPVVINALAYSNEKHTMHVQSLSHWAPANIGPYSQAIRVGDIIYVAGQIGLVPGSLVLVSGGIKRQCRLALRHVGRLVKAMDKDTQLRDVVQGVCYVTHADYISEARKEWERRTNNAIVEYVVVPELPRSALVEWQVWAHRGNTRFEYEETGCVVGENRVSLRRRWNYENTVSAVVCYVSMASSVSNPVISEGSGGGGWDSLLSETQLLEVLHYALERLFRGVIPNGPDEEGLLPPPPPCNLTLFYRTGRALPPSSLYEVLAKISEFNIAATLVPVCQLNHPNTFISIVAVRHE